MSLLRPVIVYTRLSLHSGGGLFPISDDHWVGDGLHHGQVASISHGNTETHRMKPCMNTLKPKGNFRVTN